MLNPDGCGFRGLSLRPPALLFVAVFAEALSVAAQTRCRIGARFDAVSADEVAAVNQIAVGALWEFQLNRANTVLAATVGTECLFATGRAALGGIAPVDMAQYKVAAMRKLRDRFLRIAAQILVTGAAASLLVFLRGYGSQSTTPWSAAYRLAFFRQRLVAAGAVFFGLLDVLGVRQLQRRWSPPIGSRANRIRMTESALAFLLLSSWHSRHFDSWERVPFMSCAS